MFTGLVQAKGIVWAVERGPDHGRLVIQCPWRDLVPGESVAIDGCCLTMAGGPLAEAAGAGMFVADLSRETLERTTLGDLQVMAEVHLERALRVGDRVGGHSVLGHVDGVERVLASEPEGDARRVRWSLAPLLLGAVVPQGSIAIDGASLTVASLGDGWFEAALIPATLAATHLGRKRPGDSVNVEIDAMSRAVLHGLRRGAGSVSATAAPEPVRAWTGAPWESEVGYCRAVRIGDRILVSGTAPVEPDGSTHAPGDAYRQAVRCLEIIDRSVTELGAGRAVIVRTRMFVTDAARWAEFGRAHGERFRDNPPVTTLVQVAALIAPDMLIEIEAEAWVPAKG